MTQAEAMLQGWEISDIWATENTKFCASAAHKRLNEALVCFGDSPCEALTALAHGIKRVLCQQRIRTVSNFRDLCEIEASV